MPATAYALLGPTASGKSSLAMEVAAHAPVEIVSLDSALVYRGLDIGTAKPTAQERARTPHHLIDLVDPHESYSAGRWRADAICAVGDILARGKVPLIVGGTMLYFRTLVAGLDALPQADPQVRREIDGEAARHGWPALHAQLAAVDPAAARRIMPNDAQRIQRALEVARLTGEPLSSLQGLSNPDLPFEVRAYARIPSSRPALHEQIEKRFDRMLEEGLIEEVQGLKERYPLTGNSPSMRAVGYRQVWAFLEGTLDRKAMREQAIAATRQLAKRQMTWLRSFDGVVRLDDARPGEALREAVTRSSTRRGR